MSRFMAQHYRCVKGADISLTASRISNDLRQSVIDFVLTSEPGSTYGSRSHSLLLEALTTMGQSNDIENVRRLALRLLERFDCDWNWTDLLDHVVTLGPEVGVPAAVIRKAFSDVSPPSFAERLGIDKESIARRL